MPYTRANFASLSVKVQASMLARYLENELTKMTEDPIKAGPPIPLPDDGLLVELVSELVHSSVIAGQAGREAASALAEVNRAMIGYHDAEIGRLKAMNEQLGHAGR